MTEEIKPWQDYIHESREIVTESAKKAKTTAIDLVNKHFESLYDDMEPSETETFKAFLNKMKKL